YCIRQAGDSRLTKIESVIWLRLKSRKVQTQPRSSRTTPHRETNSLPRTGIRRVLYRILIHRTDFLTVVRVINITQGDLTPPRGTSGTMPRGVMLTNTRGLSATAIPLSNFLSWLQINVGRRVNDKTDLKGLFDITLQL